MLLIAPSAVDACQLFNYSFYHWSRSGVRGGGVGVYVKNKFKSKSLTVECYSYLEQTWITLCFNKNKYNIGVIYRPPRENINSFLDAFEATLGLVIPQCDELFVVGDININLLNSQNTYTTKFLNLLDAYGLLQLVNEPTRITSSSETLIDVVVSSCVDFAFTSLDSLHGLTDHELIRCSLTVAPIVTEPVFRAYRDFNSINLVDFTAELESLPFSLIYELDDVNIKVNFFNNLIISIFDKYAPLRNRRFSKRRSPWLTPQLKQMMCLRDRAYSKYKHSKNINDLYSYKDLRRYVEGAIRREKEAYFGSVVAQRSSAKLWRVLRDWGVARQRRQPLPGSLGNADEINDYFARSSELGGVVDQDVVDFYNNSKLNPTNNFLFETVARLVLMVFHP
nr:uncharacterized protein LOC111416221 [Onthophagus taurus]